MCDTKIPSAATDFGWHDPGYIHTAQMTGLLPSRSYLYTYGSDQAGWSNPVRLRTPPSAGDSVIRFLTFGDMGQAPRDKSDEHYIQPGSLEVIEAIKEKVLAGEADSVFHIGDISYATGFLVEWDYFLQLINPIASRVPYMTAIGNHESMRHQIPVESVEFLTRSIFICQQLRKTSHGIQSVRGQCISLLFPQSIIGPEAVNSMIGSSGTLLLLTANKLHGLFSVGTGRCTQRDNLAFLNW